MDKIEGEIIYLKNIHINLARIYSNGENMRAILDELYEDFEYHSLVKKKWATAILSKETFKLLSQFTNEWNRYRRDFAYSDNTTFISLDTKWLEIKESYLKPLLISLESDFKKFDVDIKSYTNYEMYSTTTKDILDAAQNIYQFVIDYTNYEKYYLNDL